MSDNSGIEYRFFAIMSAVAVALLILSAFVVYTDETSGEQVVEEGMCGDDIRYTLYDSGRLVMEGTGYTYIELFT